MWSIGTGSDVMKRIAAPMVGGIFTSFILELLIYPLVYELWKRHTIQESVAEMESATGEGRQPELAMALSSAQD
jgi:Cu(I)/Ag(I) efflux system membrane protein CusA/SilA